MILGLVSGSRWGSDMGAEKDVDYRIWKTDEAEKEENKKQTWSISVIHIKIRTLDQFEFMVIACCFAIVAYFKLNAH